MYFFDIVQNIIQRHFDLQSKTVNLSKEVYLGLADLYANHPDFKKFFDEYHQDMIPFLGDAIRYYANKNL